LESPPLQIAHSHRTKGGEQVNAQLLVVRLEGRLFEVSLETPPVSRVLAEPDRGREVARRLLLRRHDGLCEVVLGLLLRREELLHPPFAAILVVGTPLVPTIFPSLRYRHPVTPFCGA